MVVLVILGTGLVLPFIKSWSVKFVIAAIYNLVALLFSTSLFCNAYKCKGPQGSPLTIKIRVFVDAMSKRYEKLPEDHNNANNLYMLNDHVELTRSLRLVYHVLKFVYYFNL